RCADRLTSARLRPVWPIPESSWPTSRARSAVWQRGVTGRGGPVWSVPPVGESGVVAVWSTGAGAAGTTAGAVAGAAGAGSGADWQPTAAARTTPPEASSHLDRPAKVLVISSPPLEDGSAPPAGVAVIPSSLG